MSDTTTRTKPHFNLGTLGHIDHGKTTLVRAILRAFHPDDFEERAKALDKPPESKQKSITITIAHVELETPNWHYAIIDAPGHRDYIKNMITGAAQMDGALLVISSADGVMPQTREHVLLAKQVGVTQIIPVINVFGEADEELIELIKMDVAELLEKHGFDPNAPVFVVNAFKAAEGDEQELEKIRKFFTEVLEKYFKLPERPLDKPFLMPIEDVFSITGRGTVVTGRIERGKVKVGDEVEILGLGKKPIKTTVTGVEMFRKPLEEGVAGDNVGILLRGVQKDEVERGQVVAEPGTVKTAQEFMAEVYVLTKDEGGRHKPFTSGYRPQFYIRTADVTGEIELPEGVEMVMPGDHVNLKVKLIVPVALEKGMRFAIREGGVTVGAGVVTEIFK